MKKQKQLSVQKLLCTKREACHMLGLSLSTINRRISDHTFSTTRLGKRTMLKTADVLKFAEDGYSLPTLQRTQEVINGAE